MSTKEIPPPSEFESSSRGTLTPSPTPPVPSPQPIAAKIAMLFVRARSSLNLLSLAAGITIIGLSARNLHIYNETHLAANFLLPLWPTNTNIGPTIAMIVAGAVVTVCSAVAIALDQAQKNSHTTVGASAAVSVLSFISAMSAVIVHYTGNSASADTIETWSCKWNHVSMLSEPHFGDICLHAKATAGLAVALMPLQVLIMSVVLLGFVADKTGRWRSSMPEK
ncbi:hypothetical protein CFIMG_000686RA [Ceratocystis fimbriata CBS 114723]|uniref:Uncharacterized protein n=1 Tax=Ceratocystis fimbriata CBS 114723 TaxID=1035309 RepID=A0A2C5X9I5_9PEZI|nr:hypothetical protein CFIMG_000686RA [Ceratocystis fimbriata CBS 114723]